MSQAESDIVGYFTGVCLACRRDSVFELVHHTLNIMAGVAVPYASATGTFLFFDSDATP